MSKLRRDDDAIALYPSPSSVPPPQDGEPPHAATSEIPARLDPDAAARVAALIASPAYRRADEDPDFLQRDELRHARLQLEYLKPELTMQELGIESTIVLFGSTRVVAPSVAQRRRDDAFAHATAHPEDESAQQQLRAAEQLLLLSRYYDVARDFASMVSKRCCKGPPHEFVIMTGGGPGIMEAGNRGASDVGAPSIGLNIKLPHEQRPNAYISPELCFQFGYFSLRKLHFMMRAKALIAFPGGYGTFDELFDALCLLQTRRMDPIPIVLVGKSFWRRAFDPEFLVEQGVIAPADLELFTIVESAHEIWQVIRDWYKLD